MSFRGAADACEVVQASDGSRIELWSSVHRGGSTFCFDTDALRVPQHVLPARRSDSFPDCGKMNVDLQRTESFRVQTGVCSCNV